MRPLGDPISHSNYEDFGSRESAISHELLGSMSKLCSREMDMDDETLFTETPDRIVQLVNSATKRRLGKLDPFTVREYLNTKNVPPVSILTALMFIDKLTSVNPSSHLLQEITAIDLLVVSMMVASKYLHDVDTVYGAYNADWASDFNMDLKELNQLEIEFMSALNWEFFVTGTEFFKFCSAAGLVENASHHQTKLKSNKWRPDSARRLLRPNRSCAPIRKTRTTAKILAILATAWVTLSDNKYGTMDMYQTPNKHQGYNLSNGSLPPVAYVPYLNPELRDDSKLGPMSNDSISNLGTTKFINSVNLLSCTPTPFPKICSVWKVPPVVGCPG